MLKIQAALFCPPLSCSFATSCSVWREALCSLLWSSLPRFALWVDASLIRVEFNFSHVTGETDIHSNSRPWGTLMCVCVSCTLWEQRKFQSYNWQLLLGGRGESEKKEKLKGDGESKQAKMNPFDEKPMWATMLYWSALMTVQNACVCVCFLVYCNCYTTGGLGRLVV